jgi:cytochrome c oxidase subunit I+III
MLPIASEVTGTAGWWGSVFALSASATLFASLLFGYAFLWTVAPDWPPPVRVARAPFELVLALGGAAIAVVAMRRGRWAAALAGQVAIVAAMILLVTLRLPGPATHAYAATGATVAAYAIFHAGLAAIMLAFLLARIRAGFVGGVRQVEPRIVRLWSDHAAGSGIVAALVVALPGWFA